LNSPKRNPLGDPQQFSFFRHHVETMQILLLRSVKRVRDATRKAKRGQVVELERRNSELGTRNSELGILTGLQQLEKVVLELKGVAGLRKTPLFSPRRGPSAIFIFSTSASEKWKSHHLLTIVLRGQTQRSSASSSIPIEVALTWGRHRAGQPRSSTVPSIRMRELVPAD
jgi:hypothetical protein